jgi:hypothetical protein
MKPSPLYASLAAGVALSALAVAGCSDLLEPKVYDDLTPETFFSSEADFRTAVVALYNAFGTDWGTTDQGAGTWYTSLYNADPKSYWARSEITTDELFTGWSPTFTNYTWGPATFSGAQASDYSKIRYVARATDVIDKITNAQANVPPAVKELYIAEAKALRGWLMFVLYDFFGPVNAKLDPATLGSTEITARPSAAEYIAAMERDLTEAIPALPSGYNADAANWGRVGAGTARMVLLRLYMQEKNWAGAEAVAREVTQMGYSLMPNYADVCNTPRNNELIYAVPSDASSPNWYFQEIFPSDFRSAGDIVRGPGWYGYWMPWPFYDRYDPADERLTTIIASYTTTQGGSKDRNSGMPGAIPVKCTTNLGTSSGSDADWPVFRYAETLLSLAEAINEQRGPGEAYAYVNEVRERSGLGPWSGLTQEALRDSLLVERGRELYSEGVRRQDLIRHGQLISRAQARGAQAEAHEVMFPIPLYVIQQSDGVVEQNPGY